MADIAFLGIFLVFFVAAGGVVVLCDRITGSEGSGVSNDEAGAAAAAPPAPDAAKAA